MRECDRKSGAAQTSAQTAFIKRRNFAQVSRVATPPPASAGSLRAANCKPSATDHPPRVNRKSSIIPSIPFPQTRQRQHQSPVTTHN